MTPPLYSPIMCSFGSSMLQHAQTVNQTFLREMHALSRASRTASRALARSRGTLVTAMDEQVAAAESSAEQDAEWASAQPYSAIPGPKPIPLLGNFWRFFPVIGNYGNVPSAELQRKFKEEYGPLVKLTGLPGRNDNLFLYDAEAAEKVLRNEGPWPIRIGLESLDAYRRTRPDLFEGAYGIATTQGKEWAEFRTAVNQTMMQPRNAKLYVSAIDQVSQDLIDKMRALRDANNEMPEDFYNELSKWALESITYIALDKRLGCLTDDKVANSEAQQIITAVHTVFDCLFYNDVQPSLWKFLPTPSWRRLVKHAGFIYATGCKYIEEAMERLKAMSPEERETHEYSVLERLLIKNDNPKIAVTMALDMITAGVDTTSNTSATIMHLLAQNQDKQRRLQEELDQVIPDPRKPITAAQLEELKYLRAVIKEAMRVNPIVLGNLRQTVKDMVVLGYRIPKGTDVLCMHSEMSLDEQYFPRAKEFLPERWLPGNDELKPSNNFAYMPFGFGPRTCVGRRFAQLEMETFLAKAFRNFNIEWHHAPLQKELRLLYSVASPLKYRCIDRV